MRKNESSPGFGVVKSTKRFITGILIGCLATVLMVKSTGCTSDQLATAQQDLTALQVQKTATQQAVADAQSALALARQQLKDARAVAATQPSNKDALAAVDAIQKSVAAAQSTVSKVTAISTQLDVALQTGQSLVTALQTQQAPNVAPLSALGPYGTLAGVIISLGFGVYQYVSKQKPLQTLNTQTALLTHLQDATGTNSHVAAVASAVSTINQAANAAQIVSEAPATLAISPTPILAPAITINSPKVAQAPAIPALTTS
jgi:hypothetical protein